MRSTVEAKERVIETRRALVEGRTPKLRIVPQDCDLYEGMGLADIEATMYAATCHRELVSGIGNFWWLSRRIYEFDSALAGALAATSLDEVPCDAIKFPVPEFYLCWGDVGQSVMDLSHGKYIVDGAYVQVRDETIPSVFKSRMMLRFSTRRVDAEPTQVDPVINYTISLDSGLLLTEAITRGESSYLETIRNLDRCAFESARGVAQHYGLPANAPGPSGIYDYQWSQFLPFMRETLPLLFNCLAYLSSYEENVREELPETTPMNVRMAVRQAVTEAEKRFTDERAARKGYSVVRFVRDPAVRTGPRISPAGGDRTISVHWRRGHWRLHRHGEGLALVKLLWIKPVLVGSDDGDPGVQHGQVSRVE